MRLIAPLTLVALMAVTAMSCSKEESVDTGSGGVKNKIKSYTETYSQLGTVQYSQIINVFYDDQDRIIRAQSAADPGSKFEYTYSPDHYVMELFVAGQLSIHNTCYLNNQSMVDSTVQYNDQQDTMITKYVYNNNKQLIQERRYNYTTAMGLSLEDMVDYSYDVNGLIIKEEETGMETNYFYDEVIKNTVNIGVPFMPIPVRLPTQTVSTYSGNTEVVDYTYTFDSNKLLVGEKAESSAGDLRIRTYTYY